ncbi:MAG: nucleotidyltransferase [Candidatus Methanofastidiosa archaeon]|nr:nucleotidyltransferase [Candidatus Methanofastidiosa archaeon]
MTPNWEDRFSSWASAPGTVEQEKCDRAENAIKKSISESAELNNKSISCFTQGSYRNRTTVRQESDVDVCVMCRDSFFYDLPEGYSAGDFGISTPAEYSYSIFKNDVYKALINYFGSDSISIGNKAFDLHENTYRVDADIVATFEFRRYNKSGSYIEGTAFLSSSGTRIENWPNQNYENGVTKNSATNRRFKSIVRVIKSLKYEMEESGIDIASRIPSYLIECLIWNVPNEGFGHDSLTADVRYALAHLFNNTMKAESCKEWGEINELKYLFWSGQSWTVNQTHDFLGRAWDYLGLE